MPVLLLARGDQQSRALLRVAIEARYGHSAPPIETVKIDLKGKSRVKLAFAWTWMPIDATVFVKFPSALRWDFTARPVGLPVTTISETYDGESLQRSRMLRSAEVDTDGHVLRSSEARLWTIAVMLLTPLSDPAIQVSTSGVDQLDVENTATGSRVTLSLNPDKTLQCVTTTCYNPATEREQRYTLRLTGGQALINDLMLPRQIDVLWDDELDMEMTPVSVETNFPLADDFFKL
ncbi:MAG: hypothetical protein IAE80_15825 [Anaerolinea sp.]|nr:hypothetical protein [Anaerolinea sp.]